MFTIRLAFADGNRAGWVLVETLVALIVLSIGVIAVNRAMQEGLVTRAMARDYTQARFLLEQVMGELELQPILAEGARKAGDFGEAHPRFSYAWAVSRVDIPQPALPPRARTALVQPVELPVSYLGKITATVLWTRAGRSFQRTAETLVAPERLFIEEAERVEQP